MSDGNNPSAYAIVSSMRMQPAYREGGIITEVQVWIQHLRGCFVCKQAARTKPLRFHSNCYEGAILYERMKNEVRS